MEEIDNGAADRDFPTDIHEDTDDTKDDVRGFQRPGSAFHLAFTDVREADEKEDRSQHQEDDAKGEVRHFHRFSAVRAALREILENEIAANERPDSGADRVETLRQVQATGRRFF